MNSQPEPCGQIQRATLLLLLWLLSPLPVAEAREILIHFDDVADGTIINTHYPGVTFSNPMGGNIYARDGSGFASAASNVVSVFSTNFPFFDARYGGVQARFATPVRSVRIATRPPRRSVL